MTAWTFKVKDDDVRSYVFILANDLNEAYKKVKLHHGFEHNQLELVDSNCDFNLCHYTH